MPNVIDLLFANADGQIPPRLPTGVFPPKSVQRMWKLGDSGFKSSHTGLTFVLGYASIGFMMQGETLLADIAVCGDIYSVRCMTDISTTYVILSCAKRAANLLLRRAFSPNLFRFGSPPGPACLIKHLQRRLGTPARSPSASHTQADATREYFSKSKQCDREKKVREAPGLEWLCASCGAHVPANGFIDDSRRHTSGQLGNRDAVE